MRRASAALRRLGVRKGDRVAAYAPNIPETYVLLLAAASLGAVFTSCAPEFGLRSVVDRWQQIEPTVLLAVDGYRYGAREIDRRDEVESIRAALPSLRHVIELPYLHGTTAARYWTTTTDEPLTFEPVPFAHPLYVLYSSGTTGLPKPIVHGHGGILLEHLKMLALHHDLGPADRFFWFSTTGWMMWNYLMSAPAVGAGIVLFDGDPAAPDLTALWRLVEEAGITYFGTSAPFLLACRKAGVEPRKEADLSNLRGIGSTGAPLPPEGFEWVYEAVSPTLKLASASGGTDVCTAFVGGVPLLPVYSGEITCRCLGAAVDSFRAGRHPGRAGRTRRTGDHRTDAEHAGRLLERPGREPLPGRLLRHVPRRLAARRLADHHRPRHAGDHRPLRRDAEPRRRAAGHLRVLLGRGGLRRGRRLAGGPPGGSGGRAGRADPVRGAGRRRRGRRRPARPDRGGTARVRCRPGTSRTRSTA